MSRFAASTLALILALTLAACGGDDDDATPPNGEQETVATEEERTKPDVEVPDGDPPDELEVTDIEEGDGPEAESGSMVTVDYVGVSFSDGEEFDASWDRGEPFTFQLGAGQVIQGWDEGVEGMRVGGRRQLVIPPDMAYGEMGSPPAIGPDETLVFVVDLIGVQ